jgi:hypothetical protein
MLEVGALVGASVEVLAVGTLDGTSEGILEGTSEGELEGMSDGRSTVVSSLSPPDGTREG